MIAAPAPAQTRNTYPRLDAADARQELRLASLLGKPRRFNQVTTDEHRAEAARKQREAEYARAHTRDLRPTRTESTATDILAESNILHLRFVEELSLERIGELLGLSPTTVGRRIEEELEKAKQLIEA